MKKKYLLIFLLLPLISNAQFLLGNEEIVLQFTTDGGKQVTIAKDKMDNYLIFRYGFTDQTKMEFPIDKNNSWNQFCFSWWYRGGGLKNEGIDVNYLYFNIGNNRYVVYQEYTARSGITQFGLKVINEISGEIKDTKAKSKTIQGSLMPFRENDKIQEGDELFMN